MGKMFEVHIMLHERPDDGKEVSAKAEKSDRK